jgi:RNA polymerase sigma-70 factor (ECF subfamily)
MAAHMSAARFATINGLPGVLVEAPEGVMQTTAFESDDDVIRALYVVRNPDKLRHLSRAQPDVVGDGSEG